MRFKRIIRVAWKGLLDTKFELPVHSFYEGSTEIKSNLLAMKGIGGFCISAGDGLVMIDAGSQLDKKPVIKKLKWRPKDFKSGIFYSSHVDAFAVKKFDEECKANNKPLPTVYSHELTPNHFDRYKTNKWLETAINRRQFAIDVDKFQWPTEYRY